MTKDCPFKQSFFNSSLKNVHTLVSYTYRVAPIVLSSCDCKFLKCDTIEESMAMWAGDTMDVRWNISNWTCMNVAWITCRDCELWHSARVYVQRNAMQRTRREWLIFQIHARNINYSDYPWLNWWFQNFSINRAQMQIHNVLIFTHAVHVVCINRSFWWLMIEQWRDSVGNLLLMWVLLSN